MTKIKICGLKSEEDILAVNRHLPDYIGFVFANSKRQITKKRAAAFKAMLSSRIKAVGVFVNEPIDSIEALCRDGIIDLIQLHGDEDEAYITALKRRVENPVIKAVRVQSTARILDAERLPCDMLLLDTFVSGQYGGSGKAFDYGLIPRMGKPFFLAGGLDIGNIEDAVRRCGPMCVDLSSGVETDGKKDIKKIKSIIDAVRNSGYRRD